MKALKITIAIILILVSVKILFIDILQDSNSDLYINLGAVLLCLAIVYFLLNGVSVSKDEKNQHKNKSKLQKEIDGIDKQISELKILEHKDVIDKTKLTSQLETLDIKKRNLKIDYYLKQDKKYISIKRAFDKGYIDSQEMEQKVAEIQSRIEKNMP